MTNIQAAALRREYDIWSATYDRQFATDEPSYSAHITVAGGVVEFYKSPSAARRIVDAGSGTGLVIEQLRPYFKNAAFEGLDISEGMTEACRRKNIAQRLHLCDLDTDSWPVEDAGADIVTSAGVLSMIANPQHFCAEAARILKPGGLLSLSHYIRSQFSKGAWTISSLREYRHSAEEMRGIVGESGLRVVHSKEFTGWRGIKFEQIYGLIVAVKADTRAPSA